MHRPQKKSAWLSCEGAHISISWGEVKYGNLVSLHKLFIKEKVDIGDPVLCESIYYFIRDTWDLVGGQSSLQTSHHWQLQDGTGILIGIHNRLPLSTVFLVYRNSIKQEAMVNLTKLLHCSIRQDV